MAHRVTHEPPAEAPWLAGDRAAHAVLTVAEMYRADAAAIARGSTGPMLMEAAGAAIARQILLRWKKRPVVVLCGPGNNGGDGFVAARHLAQAGWPVRVALLGARDRLKGDAAWAAGTWPGPVEPVGPEAFDGAALVIDALFGAGLDRPPAGVAAATIAALAAAGLPVVAVDVPSGVAGDTGAVLGIAAAARLTVTFFRKKPAHLLLPGRTLCGETVVADIDIPPEVLAAIRPAAAQNHPALWQAALPEPGPTDHKYTRGHVAVSAGAMAGAARLTATAAARAGAGMVTVFAPAESLGTLAALPAAIILAACPPPADLAAELRRRKVGALAIGPGLGRGDRSAALVDAALTAGLPLVLDADALTASLLAQAAGKGASGAPLILTPHDGEFGRVFPNMAGDRLSRARGAAARSGAVIVSKGFDTVIAAPDGRAAINANAPPWLATAGAGDVLAGMIAALLGQGVPAFEAAAAAVWRHGAIAARLGPGLIADDLAASASAWPAGGAGRPG